MLPIGDEELALILKFVVDKVARLMLSPSFRV
jgi:hypothetical protein